MKINHFLDDHPVDPIFAEHLVVPLLVVIGLYLLVRFSEFLPQSKNNSKLINNKSNYPYLA